MFLICAIGFLSLVDFRDLSLKTIVPEGSGEVRIDEKVGAGVIRNSVVDFGIENALFEGDIQEVISLANQARKDVGLGELMENEKLNASALEKAEHMRDHDYFDHVSPQGLQPSYFAQKQDYDYKTFGENLAEGYFSAQSVHEGWMGSQGHKENILSENFKEIGVAILSFEKDGYKTYLIVQHFGTELQPEDLVVEIVCDKKSKKNCKEAEDQEDEIEDLIEKQKDIIKDAKEAGAGKKDLNRLEENLEDLKDAEDELEDYLDECEKFIDKCDVFK